MEASRKQDPIQTPSLLAGGWFLSRGGRKANERFAVERKGRDRWEEREERRRRGRSLWWKQIEAAMVVLARGSPSFVLLLLFLLLEWGSSGLGGWRTFRIMSDRQKNGSPRHKDAINHSSHHWHTLHWIEVSFHFFFFFFWFPYRLPSRY